MVGGVRGLVGLALVLTAACAPVNNEPTLDPSASRSQTAADLLPAGCEELPLLAPGGWLVELQGRWVLEGDTSELPGGADWATEWIRQAGTCVWGVIFPSNPESPSILVWDGRIGTDFLVERRIVLVTSDDPSTLARADVTSRLAFFTDGSPALCDSSPTDCPDSLNPGEFVERPCGPSMEDERCRP